MNKDTKKVIRLMVISLILVWPSSCIVIQRFKCPQLTETELLLRLPKILQTDFKECP